MDIVLHGINSILSASVGAGGAWLYERWKRIRLSADDWRLWYSYQDGEGGLASEPHPPDKPITEITYNFTVRIFNEKSAAVGLHHFSLLFTKGRGRARVTLLRDDDVQHGGDVIRAGRRFNTSLRQITLQPKLWTVEDISGHIDDIVEGGAAVRKADAVRLVAKTADGKRCEWHITDLTPAS
jgi:hypothetical protein